MSPSDKFICETHQCTITVSGCLLRQERNNGDPPAWMYNKIPGDPRCADCKQGKQVKRGKYIIHKEEPMTAIKSAAEEFDEMVSGKKRGPGRPPKNEEPVELKTCRDCKQPFPATTKYFYKHRSNADNLDHYCKECSKKKKRPKTQKKPVTTAPKKVLSVDFTEHPDLFERLEKTAWESFRTPEMQVLAIINEETCEGA